jgi:hypothetical protein
VRNIRGVRHIEIHITELLIPDPSYLENEIAIANLKKYKSPSSDQIPAELIQAGSETLVSAIQKHKLGVREICLISGSSLLLYQFTKCVIKLTVIITMNITAFNFIQKPSQGYI